MDNIHFLRQMSMKSNNIWILYCSFSIYRFYNVDILKELVNFILYSKITKPFEDDKLFLAKNENNRKLNKKFYNPDYPLLSIIPFH